MAECIDPKIGALLHGFELNSLTEEEFGRFGLHLLECEYCYQEAEKMRTFAALMRDSQPIQKLAQDNAEVKTPSASILKKIWRYLWPETPILFKPGLVYLLVFLLAIPAIRMILHTPAIRPVQMLALSDTRSATVSGLTLLPEQDVLIHFYYSNAVPGKNYNLTIKTDNGQIIYANKKFNQFDPYGYGQILVPYDKLRAGSFRLLIADPDDAANLIEYRFRITAD
jgi:hypothetical protein